MEELEIYSTIKEIVIDTVGLFEDEIKPESMLIYDLGVDDLDMVCIAMALEKEFNINISDDDMYNCDLFDDLIGMVYDKIQ